SDGNVTGAHNSVVEGTGDTVTGSVTVKAEAGIQTVTVGGLDISNASSKPVVITTALGVLTVTGYNPATGKITYTYKETGGADNHSAGKDSVRDVFVVKVTDVAGVSSTGNLNIQIIDTAPVAKPDTNSIVEDTASVGGNVITGTGKDQLGADAAVVSGVQSGTASGNVADGNVGTKVQGLYGTITIKADGTYIYELDNSKRAVQALNDGEKLVDTFSYTLKDADGDKSTTTVTITINGKTDAPVVLTSTEDGGPVNGQFSYTGLDSSTPYAVSQQAGHGSVTIDTSGKWVYTPHADYNGQDSFVVAIKDSAGKTTTETITINLTPEKDAFDDAASASETAPVVIDVLANDAFEGSGKTVTHINGLSIAAGGAPITVDHGKVTLGTDGKLSFVADAGYSGKSTFTYTAKTSLGTPETATVNVTVTAPVKAQADTIAIMESGGAGGKSNVVLTLDMSGSMDSEVYYNSATGLWVTRFDLVKKAVADFFASGSVNAVRLYSFETPGNERFYDSGKDGGWFTNLNDAMAFINSLSIQGNGNTSYATALDNIIKTYQPPPPSSLNLVSIFLTDGQPNAGEVINEDAWVNFLASKGFGASYAVGVGPGLTATEVGAMEEVAWSKGETASSIPSGQADPNAIVVQDDVSQLTNALKNLLRQPNSIGGDVTRNDQSGTAGWDPSQWKVTSLEYLDANGVTRTFTFTDVDSQTSIAVYTSSGLRIGTFTMAGYGAYVFSGLSNFDAPMDLSSVMRYTIKDAAGNLSTTTLTLVVKDGDSQGAKAAVMMFSDADDSFTMATSDHTVTVQPHAESQPHVESLAPVSTAHEVHGTPGNDLLIGTQEDDLFIWSHGDEGSVVAPVHDVVQNFGTGTDSQTGSDKLVLDDLLQGEESVTDLSAYLHLEKSNDGKDTLIKVSTEGKLSADGSNFNQTITVKGVDLVGDAHTGTAAEQNALIKQLISQGKLTVDGQH
ncbi:MAG: VCBS domain-containing protein, partial [Acidovorax sp.]|nr:VCBS domain-containing protein [Acidovorax sp.]